MGGQNNLSIVPSSDQLMMSQEAARGQPTSLPLDKVKVLANEKRVTKKKKGKDWLLMCCSNFEIPVFDQEGKEVRRYGIGTVTPGPAQGRKNYVVMCCSNLQLVTKLKPEEK
ncbi:hypothetical protein MLD38_000611 [Melastoma candidum]|uniref:Uncharacterized protein n=1 Tax=Melastoma candidum TaxID=119954 RepID=A0ACB9SB37_9MYRT|nr:hypothetical protein MLD38_000611 [Melastoma candidum]